MSIKNQDDYIRFEGLCTDFYSKPQEAAKVDEILTQYFLNANFLNEYKQLLSFTKNSYVVAQICRGLTKCITSFWPSLNTAQKNEMKSTMWSFIEHIPQIEPFAYTLILKLNSRIIKYLWQDFTNEEKDNLVSTIKSLLSKSPEHHIMGLKVVKDLISEFNDNYGDHLTALQHRNISISLRDSVLLKFFLISLESINQTLNVKDSIGEKVREQGLDLSISCLTFNFIKTTSIETSDEVQTIQVPSDWKVVFDDPKTMQLYFNVYKLHFSSKALECLLQVTSVRKSLFTVEDERLRFLSNFIRGTQEILASNIGFQDSNNHLIFSRILDRVKANYHLSILVSVPGYSEWIDSLSTFTINTLKSPKFSPHSIYYLLSLWSKLVSSLTYIKGDPNKALLDKYTPSIIETFISNKIEKSAFSNDEDELLMDSEKMLEILEVLPPLGRLNYVSTCNQLKQLCDRIMIQFKEDTNIKHLEILNRQLSWLVYIIGSMIIGRNITNSSEEYDKLDGDLSLRVFLIMNLNESKSNSHLRTSNGQSSDFEDSRVSLELSFLYFMQKFRLVYIGDSTLVSTNIYKHMTSQGASTDNVTVLLTIIGRIAFNLKYWSTREEIIKKSLDLFWDIVQGHSTSKLLYEHTVTKELLRNHGSTVFNFLDHAKNTKSRTIFYRILAKLLFSEDNIHLFDDFMKTFTDQLNQLLEIQSIELFRTEDVKRKIIGLLRDLRGIALSIAGKRAYLLFFEWLNPKFTELFQRVLSVFGGQHDVVNVLLKFICEYVHNKSSRMIFDNYSPNGYIIFRETSKIIQNYGQLIINSQFSKPELYKKKIKNVQTTMAIFTNYLHGNYCNFGVFELYGDNCFKLTADIVFKLAQCASLDELLSFPKTTKIYSVFLDMLTNNSQLIIDLNHSTFYHIMTSFHKLLESPDMSIFTTACTSIEKLVSYAYYQLKNSKNALLIQNIHRYFVQDKNLISQTIDKIISIVTHEDNFNQFIISKLLLACIVFSQESFAIVKQKYIQNLQYVATPDKVEKIFNILLEDIDFNLDIKNKDKITINTVNFRKEMKSLIYSTRFY